MKKILALTLTIIMTCTALGSCGETAQQSAESKAETTTTTTTETTTETPAETEETTTTTTATENETTTTTEAAEETETETEPEPQTEAPSENPEETSIVTYPDNEEGLYPMPECFRRVIEEYAKSKVVYINIVEVGISEAITEDGKKFMLGVGEITVYYSGELTNINDYIIADPLMDGYEKSILYAPSK